MDPFVFLLTYFLFPLSTVPLTFRVVDDTYLEVPSFLKGDGQVFKKLDLLPLSFLFFHLFTFNVSGYRYYSTGVPTVYPNEFILKIVA